MAEAPATSNSKCKTTCVGSGKPRPTSSWWGRKRASCTPTPMAVPKSLRRSTTPSRTDGSRGRSLGRDHHDVSGTDPYRETSNIYDGSAFTRHGRPQFVGDGFRGATWISLHNGGGVGWGEVMNGGFAYSSTEGGQRTPPAFDVALGRQQRDCAPELGQKRRSAMGHRTRHGNGASLRVTRQSRGRRPHRRRAVLSLEGNEETFCNFFVSCACIAL